MFIRRGDSNGARGDTGGDVVIGESFGELRLGVGDDNGVSVGDELLIDVLVPPPNSFLTDPIKISLVYIFKLLDGLTPGGLVFIEVEVGELKLLVDVPVVVVVCVTVEPVGVVDVVDVEVGLVVL